VDRRSEIVRPVEEYEIRIEGRVDDSLIAEFADFKSSVRPAETVLRCKVRDPSDLHDILDKIQELGLELVDVRSL
jgi:hypothetical protein